MYKKLKQCFILVFIFLIVTAFSCFNKKQQSNNASNTVKDTSGRQIADTSTPNNLYNFKGTLTKDIIYTTAKNLQQVNEQLGMDVYKPANAKGKKFPLILFLHGGNFKTGDKKEFSAMFAALADSGYICVSINYRTGWGTGLPYNQCNSDTQQLKQAVYMAIQDAHTAMHYIVAHADDFSVDKNWIFIGGQSAGGIAALCTAYLSQKNADNYFGNISADFGDFDAGSNSNTNYKIRGVISMWGAFVKPDIITHATALPTIFFQGAKDPVVPFNTAHITPCSSTTLLYGTYPLYKRLKELNKTVIAHVDPNGGHGVFTNDFRVKNILCFLKNVKHGIKKQEYLLGEKDNCN